MFAVLFRLCATRKPSWIESAEPTSVSWLNCGKQQHVDELRYSTHLHFICAYAALDNWRQHAITTQLFSVCLPVCRTSSPTVNEKYIHKSARYSCTPSPAFARKGLQTLFVIVNNSKHPIHCAVSLKLRIHAFTCYVSKRNDPFSLLSDVD